MAAEPPALRIRQAVRALLLDPDHRVLLVRFEFPRATRWALPGGGIEPGEDHPTALRRELIEEVGLHDVEIGPHIWTREHHIAFLDGSHDGQRDHIHLVRVPAFEPTPTLTWAQLNAEYVFELRWWTPAELDAFTPPPGTAFVPSSLPARLRQLLVSGPPNQALDVEV